MTLAFMNIGTQEMILILVVVLLLFGGKKLPEMARGLGRGIREFKDASEGIKREVSEQINKAATTQAEEAKPNEHEQDLHRQTPHVVKTEVPIERS